MSSPGFDGGVSVPGFDDMPVQNSDAIAPLPTGHAPVLTPTDNETFGQVATYGLPALGVGLVDTLGQSLHVWHNDTVPNTLKAITGDQAGSFGNFYAQHQEGSRMGGEIVGSVFPGMLGMKLLKTVNSAREAGVMGEALMSSRAMDILLGNSAEFAAKEALISSSVREATANAGTWAGRSINTPAVINAKRSYYAARAVDSARATAAFELGSRAAFNSSSTFNPADSTFADQVKWLGASFAVGGALELAAAKFAVRSMTQAARNSYNVGAAADVFGASSPMEKNAANVIFRPGERGLGVTNFAMQKADIKETLSVNASNPTLQTNLTQDIANIGKIMSEQLDGMAGDGHAFLARTTLTPEQKELGIKALDKNPTAFLYAKKIAALPEGGMKNFYDDVQSMFDASKKKFDTGAFVLDGLKNAGAPSTFTAEQKAAAKNAEDLMAQFKPIEDAYKQNHYVIEPNGDWVVYKNRADNWLDTHEFNNISRKAYVTPVSGPGGIKLNMKNTKLMVKADNDIILHDNFRAELPANPTSMDQSALYAAGSKMIKEWEPVQHQEFVLTPKVDWRTLEMTSELASIKPEAAQQLKLGDGFTSMDDVNFHVLNEKYKAFSSMMDKTVGNAIPSNGSLLNRLQTQTSTFSPAEVMDSLNLPRAIGAEQQPLLEMFGAVKLQGMKDLNEYFRVGESQGLYPSASPMDKLKAHLKEIAGTDKDVPLAGNMLKQAVGEGKKAFAPKPMFVAATNVPLITRPDAMISASVQAMRDVQLERLASIDPKTSPLVQGVIGKIVTKNPEGGDMFGAAQTARSVQTLQDGVLSGTGQLVYQDRINEQFPALKALGLLAQDGDKYIASYVKGQADKFGITTKAAQLMGRANMADLLDFNRIEQAYRHGWDIEKMIPAPNGGMMFRLKEDSKLNPQLRALHFPDVDADGAPVHLMPDMSVTAKKKGYTPLTVSRLAGDLANAISEMSKQSGRENNALRLALGKHAIEIRDFHLPTPELSRDGTWFVRNPVGRVVATYSDPTNWKMNQKLAGEAASKYTDLYGEAHVAVPLDTIRAEHQANDDHFFSLIDYSDQLAKTGAGIQGGLAHAQIDTSPNTMKAMLQSLQQQYLNIGIRSRAAIFEPELNYARQASQAAAAQGANKNAGNMNIFDRYIATMFSQNPNNAKGFIGNAYNGIQSGLDNALSWMNAHFTELTGNDSNKAAARQMRAVLRNQSSEDEFRQFKETLPKWSPFKEANDFVESTYRQKMPWTSRGISTELAKLSSTMSLRFLDVGTAINNFAGLLTNAPSVVYALRRLPSDYNHEAWVARTAAYGTTLADGVVTFSPMKALNSAIKSYWSGELNNAMADAAKHGYFEPEYSALAQALTTPQSPSVAAIGKFFHYGSKLADNSEALSRQIAWGLGYKIGKDLHGFKEEANAYIFANNFVNEMIGNYSPNNKPAMFQGALGLPLGSFQTYMFNFYRRLYGMIERGDKAGILAQYAAQASVFGGKSVPGYSLWNSMFMSNDMGSDDFTGRVNRTSSPLVHDMLLNGTLSNIPMIFGAGDGLALYTRGSVDITQPVPTLLDMSKAPPMQFLSNTAQGIKATVDNFLGAGGFSMQQQEEIMANFTTNRAMKSIMELAANAKTDKRGQVIENSTRDAMHVAAGLLGTIPEHTRQIMDASAKERTVQLHQEDLRSTLDAKTKAIFRSGDISVPQLQSIVDGYMRAGGNPQYLGQWFRNSFVSAQTPKIQKQLQELGRSGKLLEFEDMLAAIQTNQTPNKGK